MIMLSSVNFSHACQLWWLALWIVSRGRGVTNALSTIAPKNNRRGVVLTPSVDDPCRFDRITVAHPVVLPPTNNTKDNKWKCFYYGRGDTWKGNVAPFLPTGWIGRAESTDGWHWTKATRSGSGSNDEDVDCSILAPTGNPNDWDGLHVGVGDVIVRDDLCQQGGDDDAGQVLDMFYFGGSGTPVNIGPNMTFAGLDMQIGRARSRNGGRTWERLGLCLERNVTEGLFCAFPKVCVVRPDFWRMFYHSFDGMQWTAYTATSRNQGETWIRQGPPILTKGDEGAWDDRGIGCRAVLPLDNHDENDYLMIYEGVYSSNGKHQLGVAYGKEEGDGKVVFVKDAPVSSDAPGGPILGTGKPPLSETFPAGSVGTPYLVKLDDGSLRLYFVCIDKAKFEIGCVVSQSGKVHADAWELLGEENVR